MVNIPEKAARTGNIQPPKSNADGWQEWSKHVLFELERLDSTVIEISKQMNKLNIETELVKLKCSFYGALSGMIPVIIVLAIQWLSKKT